MYLLSIASLFGLFQSKKPNALKLLDKDMKRLSSHEKVIAVDIFTACARVTSLLLIILFSQSQSLRGTLVSWVGSQSYPSDHNKAASEQFLAILLVISTVSWGLVASPLCHAVSYHYTLKNSRLRDLRKQDSTRQEARSSTDNLKEPPAFERFGWVKK
mmetsp:Transcript_19290/g.32871  ORF Transcript_19290/g.32871 Transcript_19290/m.32871 type:complete len:158 (+) Transcript_19290:287-760(+)